MHFRYEGNYNIYKRFCDFKIFFANFSPEKAAAGFSGLVYLARESVNFPLFLSVIFMFQSKNHVRVRFRNLLARITKFDEHQQ